MALYPLTSGGVFPSTGGLYPLTRGGLYPLTYLNAVLNMGPVGYWRLGESSGTVAVDEMGVNDGTYVGSPTLGVAGLLSGDPNTAVTLNGTTQYVNVPGFTLGDAFTLAVWLRRAATGVAQTLFDPTVSGSISFQITDTDLLRAVQAGVGVITSSTVAMTDTSTSHLCIWTRSGAATDRLYIDNVDVTGSVNSNSGLSLSGLSIGSAAGIYGFVNGTVDEPAIWDRALTAAEVAALYAFHA